MKQLTDKMPENEMIGKLTAKEWCAEEVRRIKEHGGNATTWTKDGKVAVMVLDYGPGCIPVDPAKEASHSACLGKEFLACAGD